MSWVTAVGTGRTQCVFERKNTPNWSIRAGRLSIISSLSSSSTRLIATVAGSSHSHQVTKSCWKFHIGKFQTFQDLPLVLQNNSRTFSVLRNLRTFQGRRRTPDLSIAYTLNASVDKLRFIQLVTSSLSTVHTLQTSTLAKTFSPCPHWTIPPSARTSFMDDRPPITQHTIIFDMHLYECLVPLVTNSLHSELSWLLQSTSVWGSTWHFEPFSFT